MGRRRGSFANGNDVHIKQGETENHDDVRIDVGGMTGKVCDDEPYDNLSTGEAMIGVKLDSEHGGGHAYVPASRLGHGQPSSFGAFIGRAAEEFDRIFGKKQKRAEA